MNIHSLHHYYYYYLCVHRPATIYCVVCVDTAIIYLSRTCAIIYLSRICTIGYLIRTCAMGYPSRAYAMGYLIRVDNTDYFSADAKTSYEDSRPVTIPEKCSYSLCRTHSLCFPPHDSASFALAVRIATNGLTVY